MHTSLDYHCGSTIDNVDGDLANGGSSVACHGASCVIMLDI